jgi:hypothetical protein
VTLPYSNQVHFLKIHLILVYYNTIKSFRILLKQKIEIDKTNFEFFLEEGKNFFLNLIKKLENKYKSEEILEIKSKFFINLGDLERYSKDYTKASKYVKFKLFTFRYYQESLNLNPFQGTAHNQLGVIATYQMDEFESIYRYIRSLFVIHPFDSHDNMNIAFEKNRKKKLKESKEHLIDEFIRIIGNCYSKIK